MLVKTYNKNKELYADIYLCINYFDKFIHLSSNISSTVSDVHIRQAKMWTSIDMLSIVWKSDLSDKIKRDCFQVVAVSILLIGCTTWTLRKHIKKKLDGNYTRMIRAVFNKSWKQPLKKKTAVRQLTSHLKNNARGVMVIVAGYEHGDTSSNPGPDWLHFT